MTLLRLKLGSSWFSWVYLQLRSSLFLKHGSGSSSGFCSFLHINVLNCLGHGRRKDFFLGMGATADFSEVAIKIFLRGPKVAKFHFFFSKLWKQPFFLKMLQENCPPPPFRRPRSLCASSWLKNEIYLVHKTKRIYHTYLRTLIW